MVPAPGTGIRPIIFVALAEDAANSSVRLHQHRPIRMALRISRRQGPFRPTESRASRPESPFGEPAMARYGKNIDDQTILPCPKHARELHMMPPGQKWIESTTFASLVWSASNYYVRTHVLACVSEPVELRVGSFAVRF